MLKTHYIYITVFGCIFEIVVLIYRKRGDIMADYKTMYLTLLDATEKAINELISAQRACEELYISSSEEEDNEEKAKNIKIVENKKG